MFPGCLRLLSHLLLQPCPGFLKPAWRTTGVLISPTIVLTAGHGTYGTTGARVSTLSYIPRSYQGYPYPGKWAIEAKAIYTYPDYQAVPGPGLPQFDAYEPVPQRSSKNENGRHCTIAQRVNDLWVGDLMRYSQHYLTSVGE